MGDTRALAGVRGLQRGGAGWRLFKWRKLQKCHYSIKAKKSTLLSLFFFFTPKNTLCSSLQTFFQPQQHLQIDQNLHSRISPPSIKNHWLKILLLLLLAFSRSELSLWLGAVLRGSKELTVVVGVKLEAKHQGKPLSTLISSSSRFEVGSECYNYLSLSF